MNYGNLPVCIAKTQLSISHDPSLKGKFNFNTACLTKVSSLQEHHPVMSCQ